MYHEVFAEYPELNTCKKGGAAGNGVPETLVKTEEDDDENDEIVFIGEKTVGSTSDESSSGEAHTRSSCSIFSKTSGRSNVSSSSDDRSFLLDKPKVKKRLGAGNGYMPRKKAKAPDVSSSVTGNHNYGVSVDGLPGVVSAVATYIMRVFEKKEGYEMYSLYREDEVPARYKALCKRTKWTSGSS
ncbi:hypothetical protein PMKS-004212 [Pichia membranifaciens]|uniref:Uncharacterized protein n=1 Tax=Pichia membranifaciens TaxID=4926 RepID=A0A1Q2YMS9_9ASCO|nr:hypothetical protein PMKS-004212 [Pichia membranifaciens]